MKQFQHLLFTLSLFFCSYLISTAQSVTMDFDNAASLVSKTEAMLEAYSKADMDELMSYFADDAVITGITGANIELTKSEYKEQMDFVKDTYTNATLSNVAIIPVKSDSGFTKGEWTATWLVIKHTVKKTGALLDIPNHFILLWEGGKVKTMVSYVDLLNIGKALGFTIAAPSTSN